MIKINEIDVDKVRKYFYVCDKSPSGLRWRVDVRSGRNGCRVHVCKDTTAGGLYNGGYYTVTFERQRYLAHRIVYILTYGAIAADAVVDHKDGNTLNNVPGNLRAVTLRVNTQNRGMHRSNSSGTRGICRSMQRGRPYWYAQWQSEDGKHITKGFSVNKLGEDQAKASAIKCREEAIKLLNEQGQDYINRGINMPRKQKEKHK